MIPFDAFTLSAVAQELNLLLVGARVQKIQQPSASDVILTLHGHAGTHRLLLSADPRLFRAHLTQVKRENPMHPPTFCMVMRKWLDGAYFEQAVLPRFDRVLHLRFISAENREPVTVVAELMGRNANVLLTTGDEPGIVRGLLRSASGGERDLRPGATYANPPGYFARVDPLTLTGSNDAIFHELPHIPDETRRWLMATFSGMNRLAVEEIMSQDGGTAKSLTDLMDDIRAERFAPHHLIDEAGHTEGVWPFVPHSYLPGRRFARESISVALDTFYATQAEETAEASAKAQLAKLLTREIAYRTKELKSAQATMAEAERATLYEQHGNLILANLSLLERGQEKVTLPDLYANEPEQTVTLPLDPKKTPHENAESYFDRARRARDAADYADGRVADLEDELGDLRDLESELARADDRDDLADLRDRLEEIVGEERVASPKPKEARPKEKPFGGFRVKTFDLDGWTLYVGESADANDHLMTRVASPTDLWMHIRAGTGAHGVLRTNGKPDRVPDTIVRKACAIVAAKSGPAKHSTLVAVDVTEKRYVRKPRGGKAGLAIYDRAKTYDVKPELRGG